MIHLLFTLSLFLGAFLLFAIQPITAKIILPIYGGSPAVWTLSVLFFQFSLLVSYGYAWFLSRFADKSWRWRLGHCLLILLSLSAFPLTLAPTLAAGAPDLALLKLLLGQLGLPLLVVGASSPLLQFAYSQVQTRQKEDPYFLFVSSNVGSLLALISYPWIIEHYIGLSQQLHYWNYAFIGYLLLIALVLIALPYRNQAMIKTERAPLHWQSVLRWIAYSFIPCSLMLGLTFYISTDIAATPLFWVLPLAVYLLTFIITFARKPVISHHWVRKYSLFFIAAPMISFIFGAQVLQVWQIMTLHLASFFVLALLCHGELVRIRPPVNQLTIFYFCLALGGVLAGIFNGLLAPRIFSGAYEYPLVLTMAIFCLPLPRFKAFGLIPFIVLALLMINYFLPEQALGQWLKTHHLLELLALGVLMIWPKNRVSLFAGLATLVIFLFIPWFKPIEVLNQQRNFYGVKQVLNSKGAYVLISQNTMHGFQISKEPKIENGAMAYYGPVLSAVQQLQQRKEALDVTIIGLGTGMMACQFRLADKLQIIDIDQQVINIADHYFSYLRDCPPKISLSEGDGRLVLMANKDASADLLVVDAFSSDAIPIHLLTMEAFDLYQQKIKKNGAILINISNRHLHLLPVIIAAGRQKELLVLYKGQPENYAKGQFPAEWVLLSADEDLGFALMAEGGWRFAAEAASRQLWTDDYSNLLPLMKWS
ncbi:spermidine synthase [Legionella massiliensis]|uniref:Spermidine synthase n=1 Tax=Legionella massiliensis TaxID=1034943 RepID=A0A078KVR8_9GAMM|nr:fused MFS/spermidine synthase [Legionella massiliensis]CDZ78525.1 spermidine synthase [Legionella massiliensis]CEE14263.1 Spermidine synthase [Legionella massiliensis]